MDELCSAFLSLESIDEVYMFLEDLCTLKEIHAMTQRFEVADLLNKGEVFSEINEITGASPATIARVNKCLKYGADGYVTTLARKKAKS